MSLVEENIIEDYIYVDNDMADKAGFALTVEGESMIGAGILKGDVVLIERTGEAPRNGQIVVASPDQDKGTTLKAFYERSDHVRLEPANQEYAFIICGGAGLEESELRERYSERHPGRELDIHLGAGVQIHGWARALIRRQVQ
jgi:SOS-response transcriptional repressor LexA